MKKNFFFYFHRSIFLIFVKIWTLIFTIYFSLISLWRKWWTYALRIMIVFQVSLNFDPAKEILKMRCNINILVKKVIILRKVQGTMKTSAPPFFSHFSLSLNRKSNCVIKQSLAVNSFSEAVVRRYYLKKVLLKFSQISQENTCVLRRDSNTGGLLWNLRNF